MERRRLTFLVLLGFGALGVTACESTEDEPTLKGEVRPFTPGAAAASRNRVRNGMAERAIDALLGEGDDTIAGAAAALRGSSDEIVSAPDDETPLYTPPSSRADLFSKLPLFVPPKTPAPVRLPEPERDFVPGEVLVSLRESTGDAELDRLHAHDGLARYRFERRVWGGPRVLSMRVRDASDPSRSIGHEETRRIRRALATHPSLRSVSLNHYKWILREPTDPHYPLQWHYKQINMAAAWDRTTGDAQTVVAVIDDGVNPHRDLNGRVIPGYDMISDPAFAGDNDGRDSTAHQVPNSHVTSSVWHGTHVAGTIAAGSSNGEGVAGIDWSAKVLPVRVLGVFVEGRGQGTSIDIIAGINWSVGVAVPGVPANPNPADVLNLSLGGGGLNPAEQDAIDAAVERGAVVVVAAGNSNQSANTMSLAGYNNVIAVGAVDYTGRRAKYSNYGSVIDVMAPGGDTEVDANADTYPDGVLSTFLDASGRTSGYSFLQGTSMAAPHVAGIVALMKAVRPGITHAEAERILRDTADPSAKCSQGCGSGLVNPTAAILSAMDGDVTGPPKLTVSGERVNVGEAETGRVLVFNSGGGSLAFEAKIEGEEAQRVKITSGESGTLLAGESAAIDISVDRDGLEDGSYSASLSVTSSGGDERVAIVFTVGGVPLVDVGTVTLGAFRMDENGKTIVGARAKTNLDRKYKYELESRPGKWFIAAVADRDGDGKLGEGDLWGMYPSLEEPKPLDLESGEGMKGLDFPLLPFAGTDLDTLPCAAERRCYENCLGDETCESECEVSATCDECLQNAVEACDEAPSCGDDGECLCEKCSDGIDECFGPLSCAAGQPGGGASDATVGATCGAEAACVDPLECDTSVSGGYCTRDCLEDGSCPTGGECVARDNDGDEEPDSALCFATCTGPGTCPRSGDACSDVGVGVRICVPSDG